MMKKTLALSFLLVVILSACGQPAVTLNGSQFATETYVKAWISAWAAHDANKMMALYAEDATYMDYGVNYGPINKQTLSDDIHQSFQEVGLGLKVTAYTITPDGIYAALNINLIAQDKNGNKVSLPGVVILEYKAGEIISEKDYYNGGPLN
jgi:ketosteroid isomerase-like protein